MKKEFFEYIGSGLSIALTAVQDNPIFQAISFVLSIVCAIVTISYTIYKWYKKASQDGKITPEELEELGDNLQDLKNKIDKEKK